jgi:hypothetical protein
MKPLTLYCKSYRTDLRRVVRLAQSIQQHNTDNLPFYVSVPHQDLALFREHLRGLPVELLADEDILQASPRIDAEQISLMPGSLSQQVVKSEFWRLGISSAYLCLDSDATFLRSFGLADFMTSEGTPYTMLDECHDLMEDAIRHKRRRVVDAYIKEADMVQQFFQRVGRRYSFGPFPLVWHREVWESLDTHCLQPKGMNLADAILQAPIESRWYGEALLAYGAIPLLPCQALFKVYHYAWQYDRDRRDGVTSLDLAQFYCGEIKQSNWEREMDWPREGGNNFSRVGRRLRRYLGRI